MVAARLSYLLAPAVSPIAAAMRARSAVSRYRNMLPSISLEGGFALLGTDQSPNVVPW